MEIFDNATVELLRQFFSDSVRADVLRVIAAGVFWRELSGIRKGLEAVVSRVDNHENRIVKLEVGK